MSYKPTWTRDVRDVEIDLAFRRFQAEQDGRLTSWHFGRYARKQPRFTYRQHLLIAIAATCLAGVVTWFVLVKPLIDLAERMNGL